MAGEFILTPHAGKDQAEGHAGKSPWPPQQIAHIRQARGRSTDKRPAMCGLSVSRGDTWNQHSGSPLSWPVLASSWDRI